MHRKIWIGLSAVLIALRLSAPAEAALTNSQLDAIEEYVASGNWARLREYLIENPNLWEGDDVLAVEFRRFLENTSSLYTALTFQDSMFPTLANVDVLPDAEPIVRPDPAPQPASQPAALPTIY